MIKSTKRLTISSEAENSNGFHVRTAGVDLAEFFANPLLLWMHKRPEGKKDELLPLGFWSDIEVNDGKITGIPNFDDKDEWAMKVYNKVENGSIRMASAGLKPVKLVEIDGKKWLEKSVMKEASIVDIGSNKECLAVALYDDDNNLVTLNDVFTQKLDKQNLNNMKIIGLNAPTLALLKLAETATEEEANAAVAQLVTLAEKQAGDIAVLTTAKKDAETKLEDHLKLMDAAKNTALAEEAFNARKITADQKPYIIGLAEKDYEGTKKFVDSMPSSPSVKDVLDTTAKSPAADLMKLSYDELDQSNKLIVLKEANLEGFKAKFKEKFGKEYNG